MIYNLLTSSVPPFTGRHQSESVAVFTGIRINPPTDLFTSISFNKDIRFLVIGDDRTPENWSHPSVDFLSIKDQENLGYSITKFLPHSHYSRKNIGYIYAKKNGAQSIIDTDDDNFPTKNWHYPVNAKRYLTTNENLGFLNIYEYFSERYSWPRGFPISEIKNSRQKLNLDIWNEKKDAQNVGIWQGLVDGEPDFDAIYRLTNDYGVYNFVQRDPIILSKGCYCPINSQNTFFIEQLFPLLYLPVTVSFRFTDILRGYIAEVIVSHKGYRIGFCAPNVVQIRNKHDLERDFLDELPMYHFSKQIVEISENLVSDTEGIANNLFRIYRELAEKKIVMASELSTLEAFLKDIT